jgi:molybdopterin molybdotransferase
MIPISEASKIIEKQVARLSAETVDLAETINRVLAEEIRADMDLPPFNRRQIERHKRSAGSFENHRRIGCGKRF